MCILVEVAVLKVQLSLLVQATIKRIQVVLSKLALFVFWLIRPSQVHLRDLIFGDVGYPHSIIISQLVYLASVLPVSSYVGYIKPNRAVGT